MIYGIGTDLLRMARVERVWQRHGQHFADKLLMPEEHAQLAEVGNKANFLAKSFAVKEAFVKAFGTGFRGVTHHDVGVIRSAIGKPMLVFSAAMQTKLNGLGIIGCHLSLSDEDGRVLAFVVLETGATS